MNKEALATHQYR